MEWISVKDRLPEKQLRVLVFTDLPYPEDKMIGYLNDEGFWWDEDANYWSLRVTHWQLLPPSPPKDLNENK